MIDTIRELAPHLLGVLYPIVALFASGHAILYKRDARAAVAWVALIWLSPFVGAILYYLFGINRIRRKAVALKVGEAEGSWRTARSGAEAGQTAIGADEPLAGLVRFVDGIAAEPLTEGNRITPLENGDRAFPAMLEAIEAAEESVALSAFIFDADEAGKEFVGALARAVARKVEVRVLVDAVGARYSWPSIERPLRRAGVPVWTFLPTLLPWGFPYLNLRNHRKILVVDGRLGFTGGLNIRQSNVLASQPRRPIRDVHFRVEGPVVAHLQRTFATDWKFTTEESLEGPRWFPELSRVGEVRARGIADGPDEDFEKLRWAVLGALANAQSSVRILTPYFVPDQTLISHLNVAAMSGVRVEILLPAKNNLAHVHWASMAILWQLLEQGCRIYLSPPPFDHSKLMVLDDRWTLLGSSNLDPRSLRLNFEFNVECYDDALAARMVEIFDARKDGARELTLAEVDGRSLPVRLRDGVARLLSPFL